MRLIYLITIVLITLPACKKEEKVEPTPAAPVTREVRYEVLCGGTYQFTYRLNGSGPDVLHTGDTTNTVHLEPGTWVQVGAGNATLAISGRLWVNGVLVDQRSAPAGLGIVLQDTIQ